jgi:predicted enzyme related to lactoylglutathione lyase
VSRVVLNAFSWYELRTTDVDAAARFYGEVLGWTPSLARGDLSLLPERARAQGAPAHWLGHVHVADLDATLRRWVERGGQPLGPTRPADDGAVAPVRDAQGAVLALSSRPLQAAPDVVAWHELHTTDREKALASYGELFGWTPGDTLDLGPPMGVYQMFTWPGADRPVGAMDDAARQPHIHTHWLFYFTVPDVAASVAAVRRLGGHVIAEPMEVPSGDRVAPCEDPQRAAFALRQAAAPR